MRRSVNARCRRLPAWVSGRAVRFTAWIMLAALASGCEYQLDSPRLPDNAGTLSIGVIRNQTATGELDIRLQHVLRSRMLRHPTFELVGIDRGDMTLDILLSDLRIYRSRNLATTNVSAILYDLSGEITLLDRRNSTYYFYRYPVAASSRLDFDSPVTETPAIRDQGLDLLLDAFAKRVETVVLEGF